MMERLLLYQGIMHRIVSVAFATASVFAFLACSSSDDAGTTAPDTDASRLGGDAAAATGPGSTTDASISRRGDDDDASFTLPDASLALDASLPPLPPAFEACSSCMETTCEPQIAACDADAYCTEIFQCAITSGCLATDGTSCVTTCASSLGLTKVQEAQETKLLTSIASSCTSCLAQCPKPDAG